MKFYLTLICITTLLTISKISGQTTLSPGDIMFIGVNSDATGNPLKDEFLFVLLVDIDSGTEIYFTDMGYTGNSAPYFQLNINNGCDSPNGAVSDGIAKWTATNSMAAGTQVLVRCNEGLITDRGLISSVVDTQVPGTPINLSSAGEAIHALQGTLNINNQFTSITMITSLDFDAFWTETVGTCDFTSSPSENPGTGYEVQFSSHDDNGYYSGTMTGSKSELQTAILNPANWTTRSSGGGYTFPLSGSFVLPVELTSFKALVNNNTIELNWKTATETNNYGFQVQRKMDKTESESDWENIGFIQGNGTTNSPKEYSFFDDLNHNLTPHHNRINYRLKQIDNDGSFAYSKVVIVDLSNITSVDDDINYEYSLEQNYPNPFNPTTTIKFTVPNVGTSRDLSLQTKLSIYNSLGQKVATLVNEQKSPGNYEVQFDAGNLSSGVYFYKLTSGNRLLTKKLMILK